MAAKTEDEIRSALERHVELWNAGDKDAWFAHWRGVTTGEPTMEDPVGTPVKRGWDVMDEVWEASAPGGWQLTIKTLYVCGTTGAVVINNKGRVDGQPVEFDSIEIYNFRDDGSVHTQTYWDLSNTTSEYAQFTSSTGDAG